VSFCKVWLNARKEANVFTRHHTRKFSAILIGVLFTISVGALALNAAPLLAARSDASAITSIDVGVVLPTQDDPRWVQDETLFHDALTAAGYTVTVLFSQSDSAVEKTNVETLISQGIKVLIICPQDGTAAAAAVEEARAAGVKVIAYDRLIRDTAAVDYYTTFDSVSIGRAQGQYLIDKAAGTGKPLYLYAGHASDNNAFLFFEGSWQALQPKIADGTFVIKNSSEAVALKNKATLTREEEASIIGQITTNWDPNAARDLAQDNLTAAKAIDKGNVFILAPNDGTARAIADVFAADPDVSSYVITGQDAEKASVQYILDGKQSMTVLKDVRTLAQDAAAAGITYLQGGTPVSTTTYNNGQIDVPSKPSAVVTVDKNNVKSALIDSGYYQLSDFIWTSTAVGVVLPTQDEPRWVQDGFRLSNAFSTAGYTVTVLFSQGDSATEKANVEALISHGIKVLIICPQDGTAAATAVEEARAAGVKVIAYDRLIRDTVAVDYYTTFDSISVGRAQGQYLIDKATGTGNPLYLYAGAASDNNAFLFFEGNWQALQPKIADGTFVIKNSSEAIALQGKATLARNEEAKIIGQVTTNWDYKTAKNLAESNLTKASAADKGNVFVLAPNDGTARAIGDVFAADPDVSSHVITGQDAEKASVQYIIDGKQSMTVFKDIRTLAKDAAAAAITYLQGGTPVATTTYNNGTINVPSKPSAVVTVDKYNVKSALIDSGYYQFSDFTWPVISSVIPSPGGVLTSTFDSTTYRFPSGTFTGTVLITHTTTFSSASSSSLEGIGHSFNVAAVYSGTGQAAQPTKPYTVTAQYTDGQKGAVKESTLAFYYWDGVQWVKEPTSTVDVDSNKVTATPHHFSAWIVMGEIRRVYLPMIKR
jgi:putative multiple sugar transport system substrate-binding protein